MLGKKKFDYKWIVIGMCALVVFVALGFCSGPQGLFLEPILAHTGLKQSAYSINLSLRYASTAIVNIFFGSLIVKLGVKKLFACGFISLTLSMVLYAVSEQLWSFYLAGIFLGIGFAWTTTTMVGYIVGKWVSEKRGTYMGFILATNGLGGAIATNILTPIINQSAVSYKNAYFIVAIICAVVGILAVCFIKDKKTTEIVGNGKQAKGDNWVGIKYKGAHKKPYFIFALISIFLTGFVLQSITGVFYSHMEIKNIPVNIRTLIQTLSMIFLTATKFLTGIIYDKKGLRFAVVFSYTSALIAMIACALVENSLIGIIICFVYIITADIALPLETIMLPIFAGDLFGRRDYSKFLGICVSVNTIGYALGAPIMGLCRDIFGTYVPMFYAGAVIMLIVAVMMQFIINSANKEKQKIALLQESEQTA